MPVRGEIRSHRMEVKIKLRLIILEQLRKTFFIARERGAQVSLKTAINFTASECLAENSV